ncbi:phage tail protein [Limnohabitans lacus]|uniref:Phage tail protein n=1 Tax=Limnohabitans lacus TaxID=3045173 RepID=A0ABT6X864_9BURK|nr:phage tail protein [Limnohabitans sp. HM2-2]MDI9234308.1 phage tail protein [Limnohabitans sp. HM2-2]
MSGGGGTISTSEPRLGALRVQQSSYGLALPIVYGRTRISGNLIWYGDFVAIATTTTTNSGGKGGGGGVSQQSTTYTYEAAVMLALCEGPVVGITSIWQAKNRFEAVAASGSQPAQSAIEQLALSFASGMPGQPTWSHLTANHPAQALGYTSTALLYSANFSLTNNAEVENHTFEVDAKLQFGGSVVDAEPSAIVQDLLTNTQYGAAFPAGSLASLATYSDYCRAMGLFISPAFTQQLEAREHLKTITDMTNSACVWSEGKLKIIPYGDETITGNGATYTPNLTPIYDLTDDDFIIGSVGEDPVKCLRRTPADAFNQVQVEYLNRANAYNVEIVEAKDQANIEKFGLRPRDPIKMHGICEAAVARRAAQLQLQRSLYVRNEYEFRLGWRYVLLEPMDLVTLTDEGLGLNRTPVRIISVEEDSEGLLSLRAEDYPFGVASATLYPTQAGAGFSADYNAAPGNVATPVFFEPPIELATATGLEVWCAVSGQAGTAGDLWGGCNVWASIDGVTYKQVGTVRGGARYGTTTAALASNGNSMPVALAGRGGQMLSGTAQDAQLLNTLCWVGTPAGGEFVAHTTATLTAPNAYTLGGLVRGAYTTPMVAHGSGQQFVRVDDAICKGDPLDVAMIGQPLYFKFCSFNAYGGGTQTLTEVQAYSYTITGSMLKLPPSNVTGLGLQIEGNGVRVSWAACPDVDYASTIVRLGASWAAGAEVANKSATSHLLGWQLAGPLKVWAAHVDQYGNTSTTPASATITITAPAAVVGLALSSNTTGLAAKWTMPALAATAQPVDRVELSWSVNFATLIQSTKATSVQLPWVTPGLKELFVRAIDVAGNVGPTASASLVVRSPSAPVGLGVAIGTQGPVASWGAPAVAADQQPLGGVQLSYWADFSNIIETRSATSVDLGWLSAGTRTLYARYTDLAGNSGAAASIAFSVSAPSAPAALQLGFGTSSIEASWQAPAVAASQQALDRVELSWASAFTSIIDGRKSTTTTFGWMAAGTYTLYARYVDMAGNIGAVSQATLQVQAPAQPVMTAVETQVNLVTLRWQDAKTSQPIRKYAIYYGEAGTALAAAMLYGSAGADSRSDILQYRSSGAKVAYLVAEDVAGNVGAARQIDLNIKMPDNFVLSTEYYEDWQSTELTNGTIVGGAAGQIILPAYDGRTWGQRLSNNGWTTAQQKVSAGYPVLVQPVPASGKHVERKDCGKIIATSVVRVTPTVLSSSVAGYTPTIRIRASVGASTASWQPWLVGESASFSDFQHVEVEYSVVSDGKGFVVLDDLYVKVEVTEITESATLVLNPADLAGTAYTCTKPFLDVRAVQVTPVGANSMARPPYYVIDDSTLPAKVYVFAHDASNNRTGGTVSLFMTGV